MAAGNLGEVLVSQGRLDEAEETLREARRALRAAGYTAHALFTELQLARVALDRGRGPDALAAYGAILAEAAVVGNPIISLEASVHYAHAAAVAGDPAAGLAALDEASSSAGAEIAVAAVAADRARAECLLALGRPDEAEPVLARALAGAERQRMLHEQLLVRDLRCRLARSRGEEPAAEEVREADRLRHLLGLTGS
jgi:ATP/maltotriose-dependent transcriptional regulator MalT